MQTNQLLQPSKIIYSKRKSISLVVDAKGDFFVRAPFRCGENKIFDFIAKKADWIIKKRIASKIAIKYPPLTFTNGEKLPLFDEECTIELCQQSRVKKYGDLLYIPQTDSRKRLINYLRLQLKKYLLDHLPKKAEEMGVGYESISISSARTNWGSCSGKNKLHFTYRLAMCPSYVIDYIIVHELSHILEKNHSNRFWNIVIHFDPNYDRAEKWLKNNRYIMDII